MANQTVGRVGIEPTYEYLIRVPDATSLPYAPSTLILATSVASCNPFYTTF